MNTKIYKINSPNIIIDLGTSDYLTQPNDIIIIENNIITKIIFKDINQILDISHYKNRMKYHVKINHTWIPIPQLKTEIINITTQYNRNQILNSLNI